MHETATNAISFLRTLDAGLEFQLEQQESFCAVHLPAAQSGDYRFTLYVYDDGEPQVCATVLDGDPGASFWSWPFEDPDYRSPSEREKAFFRAVQDLLTSTTRISQKRGLLFTSFRCEVLRGDQWTEIGPTMSYWRWGKFLIPATAKSVIYESPALIEP